MLNKASNTVLHEDEETWLYEKVAIKEKAAGSGNSRTFETLGALTNQRFTFSELQHQ